MSESYTGFSDMPPVFATAFMIGLVEWACVEALSPFLGAGEHTVGIHVDVSHVSATPVGMKATAERSEEHTSELQSLMRISYAVFCLKKKKQTNQHIYTQ